MISREKFNSILHPYWKNEETDFSKLEEDFRKEGVKTSQELIVTFISYSPPIIQDVVISDVPIHIKKEFAFKLYKNFLFRKFNEVIKNTKGDISWKQWQTEYVRYICGINKSIIMFYPIEIYEKFIPWRNLYNLPTMMKWFL